MATPHTNAPHVSESQSNKEATINNQADAMDNSFNDLLDLSPGSGDVLLTAAQFRSAFVFRGDTGTASSAWTLAIPTSIKKHFAIINNSGWAAFLGNEDATSDEIEVPTGSFGVFYTDGTTISQLSGGFQGTTIEVQDDGAVVTSAAGSLNFTGAITADIDSNGQVNITAAGGGNTIRVSDEDALVNEAVVELNFIGSSVQLSEDSAGVVDITIGDQTLLQRTQVIRQTQGTVSANSTSAYAAKGFSFTLSKAMTITQIEALLFSGTGETYQCIVGAYNSGSALIENPIYQSDTVTMTAATNAWVPFTFDNIEIGPGEYIILVVNTSGTGTTSADIGWGSGYDMPNDDLFSNWLSTRVAANSFNNGDDVSYGGGTGDASVPGVRILGAKGTGFSVANDVAVFVGGVAGDEEIVMQYMTTRAFRLPASLAGSDAEANTAPTGTLRWTVLKNTTQIGVIEFAASTIGTFSGAGADFALGDRLSIVADEYNTGDTLADVAITLKGTRLDA